MRPLTLPAALAVLLASLCCAGVASADSASLTFTDAAGKTDPAAGVGRTATLSGSTASPKRVYVAWRAGGGSPCAPSASSDSGKVSFDGSWNGDSFFDAAVNGDFTRRQSGTWGHPGTYLFCIWIADSSSQSVTPISQTVTFRAPSATVSGSVDPTSPTTGQSATLTVTGASEAPKRVYATIRAGGGAPCATTYDADTGKPVLSGTSVNGSFNLTADVASSTAGDQLVCLWVADSSSDSSPVAGPQPVMFTVTAPPPPPPACLVPAFTPGSAFAAVSGALVAASCTVGKRTYAPSSRYARGTVIRLTPPSGTSLANNAAVAFLLSSGAPCRVPAARRGMRLTDAKARLVASGCSVGRVVRRRSRTRRGRVIAFSPSSGTRLSPRSTVGIIVSRGRRR